MTALASMTGFARAEGRAASIAWVWELRSVNGRGLDLRFRLPSGLGRPWSRDRAKRPTKVLRARQCYSQPLGASGRANRVWSLIPRHWSRCWGLAMELHQRLPGSPVPRAEALLGSARGSCGRLPADEAAVDSGLRRGELRTGRWIGAGCRPASGGCKAVRDALAPPSLR